MTRVIDDNSHAHTAAVRKKKKSKCSGLDVLFELPLVLVFISVLATVHLSKELTQKSVKAFANAVEWCCHSCHDKLLTAD